jgi:hypothetical protein
VTFIGFVLAVVACGVAFRLWTKSVNLRSAEFIRTYRWPRGLMAKLMQRHNLTRKQAALVSRGLRQYFIAYLMSGRQQVSMPSEIADALWHEFILFTREYDAFCNQAFGRFMHHAPAIGLTDEKSSANEGLRRVWRYTCLYENIDPKNPTRLPLLFALDDKLNIPNGFYYSVDCQALRDHGAPNRHCATDFNSGSGCSGGCSGGSGGEGGDGGGDGGCGGGCGGGGD